MLCQSLGRDGLPPDGHTWCLWEGICEVGLFFKMIPPASVGVSLKVSLNVMDTKAEREKVLRSPFRMRLSCEAFIIMKCWYKTQEKSSGIKVIIKSYEKTNWTSTYTDLSSEKDFGFHVSFMIKIMT